MTSQAKTIAEAEAKVRQAGVGTPQLNAALATLQASAAVEKTVLPISQTDELVYVGPRTTVAETSFGPGWQLGAWGMKVKK